MVKSFGNKLDLEVRKNKFRSKVHTGFQAGKLHVTQIFYIVKHVFAMVHLLTSVQH